MDFEVHTPEAQRFTHIDSILEISGLSSQCDAPAHKTEVSVLGLLSLPL